MKRIELIGASGSGKTTAYNSLLKTHSCFFKNKDFFTAAQARNMVLGGLTDTFSKNKGFQKIFRQWIHYDNLITRRILRVLSKKNKEEFSSSYSDRYQDFIMFCLTNIVNDKKPAIIKMTAIKILFEYLYNVSIFEAANCNIKVLLDGGLGHKVNEVMLLNDSAIELAPVFFRLMPSPSLVIHLDYDSRLVMSQVKNRKHQIAFSHILAKSDHELEENIRHEILLARIGAEVLSRKGVPVITIRDQETLLQKKNQIISKIKAL